jgi:hypothetical protein
MSGGPAVVIAPRRALAETAAMSPRAAALAVAAVALALPLAVGAQPRDGQHDFDFEIGTWKTHLQRRVHPLTGSNEWTEMDGISTVRKILDGRANLVELVAGGPGGHFEGMNLRLYHPETRQWYLHFANATASSRRPRSGSSRTAAASSTPRTRSAAAPFWCAS